MKEMISNNDYAFLSITITHTHTWGDVIVRGGEVNVIKSQGVLDGEPG